MALDLDQPIVQIHEAHTAWLRHCPKCGAKPDEECTSIVSGCCIEGVHEERTR